MNLNITSPSTKTRKIQIEQNVPSGSVRRGPYAIERSINPNEVFINRRFGEGSKPLFERDDIVVNPEAQPKHQTSNSAEEGENQSRKESHKSTDSSSPERFRKYHSSHSDKKSNSDNNGTTRHTKAHQPSKDNHNRAGKQRSLSPPPNRQGTTPEKVPYFIDEVRERDRIRRKYGTRSNKSPSSPVLSSKFRRRRSDSKTISRSITHSAERSRNRTNAYGAHSRRSASVDRYMSNDSKRGRENLRIEKDRVVQYRHSSHRSEERERYRRNLSPCSRKRSRTRSRERRKRDRTRNDERHRQRHCNHDEDTNEELSQRNLTPPQIITIPVPVPADFMNYAYPAWPTQTQWPHSIPPPTRYGVPAYHMPTVFPATFMPPLRPPLSPYGLAPQPVHYSGRGYRFPPPYAPRPWRPNFRPKTQK